MICLYLPDQIRGGAFPSIYFSPKEVLQFLYNRESGCDSAMEYAKQDRTYPPIIENDGEEDYEDWTPVVELLIYDGFENQDHIGLMEDIFDDPNAQWVELNDPIVREVDYSGWEHAVLNRPEPETGYWFKYLDAERKKRDEEEN